MAQSEEIQKLVQGIGSGQIGRRDFLRRAAILGLSASAAAAVLAACGGSPTATTAPAASAAPASAAPASAASGGGATAVASARPSASAAASSSAPAANATPNSSTRTGITAAEWNPESIRANAGTLKVDTKADVAKITPLDYKGNLKFWYTGPDGTTPPEGIELDKQFFDTWNSYYPNMPLKVGDNVQNIS